MQFYLVYIREAHPIEAWRPDPVVVVNDPVTDEERAEIASACVINLKLPFPALVDRMENRVGREYCAWPDRLYLIDETGRIAYKSGLGPRGFRPAELGEAIAVLLSQAPADEPAEAPDAPTTP